MTAYYNEIDPYAAQWLRNLISKDFIAPGDVDERSVVDVKPDDLKSYTQCHFFAGIGGWSLAARIAGWPDDRPLWTGSCPCQPFSVAGKGEGQADERHLWPAFFDLIRARRPAVIMGEQVAAAVGKDWLDGVHSDLESIGYACGAAVVPACAVDAPHRRDRLWFVADAEGRGLRADGRAPEARWLGGFGHSDFSGAGARVTVADTKGKRGDRGKGASEQARRFGLEASGGFVSDAAGPGKQNEREQSQSSDESGDPIFCGSRSRASGGSLIGHNSEGSEVEVRGGSPWSAAEWLVGADGKARRVEPGIRLLAHGVPGRVGQLRAYGNAIVPEVAAEVIGAYLDISTT